MAQKVVSGSDIVYSFVSADTSLINSFLKDSNVRHHQFAGYVCYDNVEDKYSFYSVEDKYENPILDHWTTPIVEQYNNEAYLVIKEHPCKLFSILTDIYRGNMVCNINSFDIWKSDKKNCLVAVVTDIEID
jgi:hypothetical protein